MLKSMKATMGDAEKMNISKCVWSGMNLKKTCTFDRCCKNGNSINLLLIGACSCDRMYVSGESSVQTGRKCIDDAYNIMTVVVSVLTELYNYLVTQ